MAGKNWKGWAWDSKHGFTFGEMWHLLLQANTLDTSTEFSNTLLIGLFWEESTFQNWWQRRSRQRRLDKRRQKGGPWLACEGKLNSAGGNFTPEILTDALNAAEPNHGPNVQYVLDTSY